MSALLKALRSRFSSGCVLAFHDIEPSRLAELVDSLQPAEVISLSEMVDRSKRGQSTSGLFAITVDDGVGQTVHNLSNLFRARSWPATFYLPTDYLESEGMPFQWWRNLLPLLPSRKIELKSGVLDLSKPGSVPELSQKMEKMWHTQKLDSYLPFILELADFVTSERGLSMDSICPPKPITWPDVARISRDGLISFESHGVTHSAMSALTDQELIFELKHSRDTVASHTGRPCRHLAYPFGSDQSIGSRASVMAQQFYDSAVTMSLGGVDQANPWLLPRIPLYPENSTRLAKVKVLMKCTHIRRPSPTSSGVSASQVGIDV
jgi:peptidoglycan/xylan/chitin deacetylase (PgdA/CDA1 family)